MEDRRRRFTGFSLVELLTVIAIIGLLIQMLLPAIQSAREAARNLSCKSNIRQLAMGALGHESAHKHFPTGGWGTRWTGDPDRGVDKRQPGGWCYNILPYVEQQDLHSWGAGEESAAKSDAATRRIETPLPLFYCSSRRSCKNYHFKPSTGCLPANYDNLDVAAKTDYAANGGDVCAEVCTRGPASYEQAENGLYEKWSDPNDFNGIVFQRSVVRLDDIQDGSSSTYLIGEKFYIIDAIGQAGDDRSLFNGADWDMIRYTFDRNDNEAQPHRDIIDGSPVRNEYNFAWGSPHPNGFNMSFCDGSVRSIPFSIDFKVHRNLANRRDGEVVDKTEIE
jgi:prepilin-type processing-associated H-X9-DG protein/prepilin-type N-terminal cleavage/methylation domain-containing protein